MCALNLHENGVFLVLLGDCENCRRHGGRKQHGLPFLRCLCEHGFDVFTKAHVQHFVRLVEYNGLKLIQLQSAPAQMIQHTSRCANHQIGAVFQLVDLPFHAGTAVHCHRMHVLLEPCKLPDLIARLHRQFSRGAENQRTNVTAVLRLHLFQNWNAERSRLSGSGIGLTDDIFSLQQQRDGFLLNFRHLGKIQLRHRLQQRCR